MKVKFLTVMAAVALMTGFTSCSNDDDAVDTAKINKGTPTAMDFTITMPHVQTYASTDGNATTAEIDMKNVNVLIYEESTPGSYILEKIAPLTAADFSPVSGTPDTYTLNVASKITTTTGNKRIYVAMNFAGTYPVVGTPESALPAWVHTLSSEGELSNTTNGWAMFSVEKKDANLVTETDAAYSTANRVKISVKRMVAKISVQENAALRTGGQILSQGGILTNLQFAVGHANKSIFPLQKRVGGSPSIMVQDNNWASFATTDFFDITNYTLASPAYKAVDAATATAQTVSPVYAPENTAQTYDVDGKNLTYISVRAQYAPAFFADATGTSKGVNTVPATFWTVTKTDGSILYFNVETEANTYQAATSGSVKSAEYTNGLCYFRVYLNKTGAPDAAIAGSVANKFDVLRNNYYITSIKSIKAPGKPTDEGKVTEPTTIITDVEVEPWQPVVDDYDI